MFTKDDLKTGMVVEIRDGKRYLVLGNRILSEKTHINFDQLDDDMICGFGEEFDIIKIYKDSEKLFGLNELNDDRKEVLTLIWQREEKSQVQIEIEQLKKERDDFNKKMDERLAKLESM